MNVLLVSECSKQALKDTRKIIDQFAERMGRRTWQTAITEAGLVTLRQLLKKNARRNTAVACHWLKKSGRRELLWIVGRRQAFNIDGIAPTNKTQGDAQLVFDEQRWRSAPVIAVAAAIAGLFHDFGKANQQFQDKLHNNKVSREPYRHEWLSLLLFECFVNDASDQQWLSQLGNISASDDASLLARFAARDKRYTQFARLDNFAQLVGWLIVSHHRLPLSPVALNFAESQQWLEKVFAAAWNSPEYNDQQQFSEQEHSNNLCFNHGTPLASQTWQKKAKRLAHEALKVKGISECQWLHQRFTAHIARMCLMLSDHYFSSLPAAKSVPGWCDPDHRLYANTDREAGRLKQKLDQHNVGVACNGYWFARSLPRLRNQLASVSNFKVLSRRVTKEPFAWQNKAYEAALSLQHQAEQQGFFGINMASTGKGKTFANAKIMYGLSNPGLGMRCSIALGLRTLTLQTGDALKEKLKLDDDDIATIIGSNAVKALHDLMHQDELTKPATTPGSESAEALFEATHIRYEGNVYDARLKKWLKEREKLNKMVSAPILVCTVDHLINATESLRGGKQIAPMLRLLSADLVLDEVDDFDNKDLPALCRLVNFAGVLGARVLISSATIPPALANALFQAYYEGRKDYNAVNAEPATKNELCCAWFDEFGTKTAVVADAPNFRETHDQFVRKRGQALAKKLANKKAAVVNIADAQFPDEPLELRFVTTIYQKILQFHQQHAYSNDQGHRISTGLVRINHINNLVKVAKRLMAMAAPKNVDLCYCVYHSAFPLAHRSYIEARLDGLLNRKAPEALWQNEDWLRLSETTSNKNKVLIVIATSVAEVGRDHDYDWLIKEPTSMRSLIQAAGRVLRHRENTSVWLTPNIAVSNKNIKALQGKKPAYIAPGFESKDYPLATHDLNALIEPTALNNVDSRPRILPAKLNRRDYRKGSAMTDWVKQEQRSLAISLFGELLADNSHGVGAHTWWQEPMGWHGEMIKRFPFRKSSPDDPFCLYWPEGGDVGFYRLNRADNSAEPEPAPIKQEPVPLARGVYWLFQLDSEQRYTQLSEQLDLDTQRCSRLYGEVRLRRPREGDVFDWYWHPQMGFYQND